VFSVTPPEIAVPPPGNDVPSPFGEKIIKIVATRGQISRLKCTKYYFGWGSAPDPAGGDYSARSEPLAGRGQPTYKGDGRKGRERGRGSRKGRDRKKCSVPPPTFE